MINILDVAMPDPVRTNSNVSLFIIIGLSVLLVISIVVTLIILSKKKNK